MRPSLLRLVPVLAVLVLGMAVPTVAGAQETAEVGVADGDQVFAPATVTIAPGDSVRWVWRSNSHHTVTFEDPAYPGTSCFRVLRSCAGWSHTVRFPDVGQFGYSDSVTGATGVVVVREPAPSPSPSPSPSPTPTPTASPPAEPSPSPSPIETVPPSPSPTPQPDAVATAAPVPTERAEPPAVAPEADPSPTEATTFEPFPEARDPVPVDVADDVDLGTPAGASRAGWTAMAALMVIGTVGAFGRVVLFGSPWDT